MEVLAIVAVLTAQVTTIQMTSADRFWMSGSEMRTSFVGRTITGEYVDARTFTEQYDASRTSSGTLNYKEPTKNRNWVGRWSIVRDRFCTIYDNSGTGGCFRVHQVSVNCFEFYFDTRTEDEARQSTSRNPNWTARAWRAELPSTCQDRPMV